MWPAHPNLLILMSSTMFGFCVNCTVHCSIWDASVPLLVLGHIFFAIASIYKPTNAHIISHKTLLKPFKTLRHVSILSDHHQGAFFLAEVILRYLQFNSYLQTRCCGSISCCVGMCCGAVARCASYEYCILNTVI